MTSALSEREKEAIFTERRKVAEYRIWGQGLMGAALLMVQVKGTVWGEIWAPVLFLVAVCIGVCAIYEYAYEFKVDIVGHQVLLTPMSFLLVFRCSNSYQRYWDGRSLLGQLVFHSRELVMKACAYTPYNPEGEALVGNIRKYTIILASLITTVVSQHWKKIETDRNVRKQRASGPWKWDFTQIAHLLDEEEHEDLVSTEKNHPLLPLIWLRQEINNAHTVKGIISPFQEIEMSSNVGELQQVWNGMAKITSTPLPYPWVHVSRVVLYIYLLTLIPPAVAKLEWFAVLFILVVSFLFFGLVQIGNEMEDPFGTDVNDFDLATFEKVIVSDLETIAKQRDHRRKRAARHGSIKPAKKATAAPYTVGVESPVNDTGAPGALDTPLLSRHDSQTSAHLYPPTSPYRRLTRPDEPLSLVVNDAAYNSALIELRSIT